MAIQMGMSNMGVQNVFAAGMLHDIGKIGFTDALPHPSPYGPWVRRNWMSTESTRWMERMP